MPSIRLSIPGLCIPTPMEPCSTSPGSILRMQCKSMSSQLECECLFGKHINKLSVPTSRVVLSIHEHMGKPQPGTRPVLALLANRDTITYNSILVSVFSNLSLHCSSSDEAGWNSACRIYCIPYQPEERKIRSCPPT